MGTEGRGIEAILYTKNRGRGRVRHIAHVPGTAALLSEMYDVGAIVVEEIVFRDGPIRGSDYVTSI